MQDVGADRVLWQRIHIGKKWGVRWVEEMLWKKRRISTENIHTSNPGWFSREDDAMISFFASACSVPQIEESDGFSLWKKNIEINQYSGMATYWATLLSIGIHPIQRRTKAWEM